MTKFIAKFKVKYNGKYHAAGSVVEVQDKHVEDFKKFGWEVVEDGRTPGAEPPTPEPDEQEEVDEEEGEAEGLGFTAEFADMTKDQIKEVLRQRGIKFPVTATKVELLDLIK